MADPIYLFHGNRDFATNMTAYPTLEKAMDAMAQAFEAELPPNDPKFGAEIDELYEADGWKGATLHALDPQTLKLYEIDLHQACKALGSNHARLAFEEDLCDKLGMLAA